jgi:hypothetical protein
MVGILVGILVGAFVKGNDISSSSIVLFMATLVYGGCCGNGDDEKSLNVNKRTMDEGISNSKAQHET